MEKLLFEKVESNHRKAKHKKGDVIRYENAMLMGRGLLLYKKAFFKLLLENSHGTLAYKVQPML